MVEDDALRAVFFDPDDFGKRSSSSRTARMTSPSTAIFDARPVINPVALAKAQVGFKDGMSNTGASPQLRCRTSDVPDVKAGQALVLTLAAATIPCGMSSRTARACHNLIVLKVA
jgi:hypothetical protein